MGNVIVVVGGQFGSEGKGNIAGWLSRIRLGQGDWAVRVAGPNAGHTVWSRGKEYKFRSLPVAAVVNRSVNLAIAAGSEIDERVLWDEIQQAETDGWDVRRRLAIDGEATILEPERHQAAEKDIGTGTTGKGIGAARSDRLLRKARRMWDSTETTASEEETWTLFDRCLGSGGTVLIEGTQGYGLGLHAGLYPHCTSSDCRAIDFLGMAGISPWSHFNEVEVWVVMRTYPIRIAGNSGPLIGEMRWKDLGVPEERTTVTNKVRRVGGWDAALVKKAVQANGGKRVRIALTMIDYIDPAVKGATKATELTRKCWQFIQTVEEQTGARVRAVGTGPETVIGLMSGLGDPARATDQRKN